MSTPPESKPKLSGEFQPTKLIEYRIVMVGRTGEGKSATANTIFGSKVFESKALARSVTSECNSYKATVFGHNLLVVDTPGLLDTGCSHEEIGSKILKFAALTAPGPHIMLLVMKIGRGTKEVQETYARLCKLLGNKGHPYTIIVFTGGDDLEDANVSPEEFVENATASVKAMVVDSGYRYVVFNNRLKDKECEDQVNRLIQKIDSLVQTNEGGVLSSEFYYTAEEALLMKENEEREALLKKKEAEESKLKERRQEQQKEIESFKSIRTRAREYEQKISNMEQEYEDKCKSLEYRYRMKLVQVRDETRQQINEGTVNVSDPWFSSKLQRFLKR